MMNVTCERKSGAYGFDRVVVTDGVHQMAVNVVKGHLSDDAEDYARSQFADWASENFPACSAGCKHSGVFVRRERSETA